MDKDIPLWFCMGVGHQLYKAESDEVKAEIDQLRENEKEDAIAMQTSTTFTTNEERHKVMKRFEE